jgi:hypothetical protein
MKIGQIFPVGGQDNNQGVVTIPLSLVSTCNDVHYFSGSALISCLVVDSGASVCKSPHKEDFIEYGNSMMKIQDLSSSNKVAGEGILCWKLTDIHGSVVKVEVK